MGQSEKGTNECMCGIGQTTVSDLLYLHRQYNGDDGALAAPKELSVLFHVYIICPFSRCPFISYYNGTKFNPHILTTSPRLKIFNNLKRND